MARRRVYSAIAIEVIVGARNPGKAARQHLRPVMRSVRRCFRRRSVGVPHAVRHAVRVVRPVYDKRARRN